jgi:hypothetical protein
MDKARARVRGMAATGVAVLTLVASACGSSKPAASSVTSADTGKSASAILALALGNARKAGTMSYTTTTQQSGATQTVVGLANAHGGELVLTSGTGVVKILVIGNDAWIESNSGAYLASALSLSAAVGSANADKWISLTSSDPQFSALATATSFSSTLAEFTPGGSTLGLSHKTVSKRRLDVIDGTGTAPGAAKPYDVQLAVTSAAPVLPVGGATTLQGNGKTLTQIAVFSHWGQTVSLKPPTGATPLPTISAGTATTSTTSTTSG